MVEQCREDESLDVLSEHIYDAKLQLFERGLLKKGDLEVIPIPEEEIPFDIPASWRWYRLGELASEKMGKTPPRGEAKYWSNGKYPWVSISDMKDYSHIVSTRESVSEYAAEKAFRALSPAGSLLMSFKLTVCRTSILDIDAFHNEAIITIVPYYDRDNALRNYLFYVLPLLANLGDSCEKFR